MWARRVHSASISRWASIIDVGFDRSLLIGEAIRGLQPIVPSLYCHALRAPGVLGVWATTFLLREEQIS
jgi:hypothetical protein